MKKSGKIITFYSYHGGTGRTTAVSNIAWILASNGYRVLLIDGDLEAPGLHRYLRPFLGKDPELKQTRGLLDFLLGASQARSTSLRSYAIDLDWTFSGDGAIAIIPAGRQNEQYAESVSTFNWDHFFRAGGRKLLTAEGAALRLQYDYILVDSRAGVSEIANICAVQIPDLSGAGSSERQQG
jgi:MinD-like ATPase involved in chromosome partitioning or flagellar assembly